ncbi:MAG: sirohydrochlorin chelatase, partial [Actinobacteria bacterium]|nr:sirohydrochlorin chelatase [Actinomycetota bacterium]
MAAPALVALAHGSRDPRSAATITALVAEVRRTRPDLRVEAAFLDLSKPSFQTVVDRLVKAGHDEIVVVPLLLTEAYHARVDVPEEIAAAASRHEGLQIRATAILGLEPCFLE